MISNTRQWKKSHFIVGSCIILVALLLSVIALTRDFSQRRVNMLLDLGQKYLTDMSYENAIVTFDEIIAINPRCEHAYMGKAQAQYALGNYQDAIETLKDGIEKTDDNIELENFLQRIWNELTEIEGREEVVAKMEEELEENEIILEQVLEAWKRREGENTLERVEEVSHLLFSGLGNVGSYREYVIKLLESTEVEGSYYYGDYDDMGERSGIGVAFYKIYDVWDPNYEWIYCYIGEWKNGMRNGKGDWCDYQSSIYECNWVDDMPEGEIKWYRYAGGYHDDFYYDGVVIHGLFDGLLTHYSSGEADEFLMYSNGHLDYFYIDFFGDYAVKKEILSSGEIDYCGIEKKEYEEYYGQITHGIPGFADTQYHTRLAYFSDVSPPPTN